jgi:flavin-dependent dehydrogenase
MDEMLTVVGAGPAGLAAAITLARAGRNVTVYESAAGVGHRFGGDLQGLENWTTEEDVLESLQALGITTDFSLLPCQHATAFDAFGESHQIKSHQPFLYLVERGPASHTLDSAMLRQAQSLGVEVCFNHHVDSTFPSDIYAGGPSAANGRVLAISVGYHFETDMQDGFWVICDNALAPGGYAYTLVMNGYGTVKTCMFSNFKQQKKYVQRTVETFTRLIGLRMHNEQSNGGVGHFKIPTTAIKMDCLRVGEAAGFQDALWGFGIRIAIDSGVAAARAILENRNYDSLWKEALYPLLETSKVNRMIFNNLGNRGYRAFLRHLKSRSDPRHYLFKQYHPSLIKTLLRPLS